MTRPGSRLLGARHLGCWDLSSPAVQPPGSRGSEGHEPKIPRAFLKGSTQMLLILFDTPISIRLISYFTTETLMRLNKYSLISECKARLVDFGFDRHGRHARLAVRKLLGDLRGVATVWIANVPFVQRVEAYTLYFNRGLTNASFSFHI